MRGSIEVQIDKDLQKLVGEESLIQVANNLGYFSAINVINELSQELATSGDLVKAGILYEASKIMLDQIDRMCVKIKK